MVARGRQPSGHCAHCLAGWIDDDMRPIMLRTTTLVAGYFLSLALFAVAYGFIPM